MLQKLAPGELGMNCTIVNFIFMCRSFRWNTTKETKWDNNESREKSECRENLNVGRNLHAYTGAYSAIWESKISKTSHKVGRYDMVRIGDPSPSEAATKGDVATHGAAFIRVLFLQN